MSLTVERYSEKSYVVRGDTRASKDLLKENKLRYNGSLQGGPGWIFPASRLEEVMAALGEKVSAEGVIEKIPRASRSFTFDRLPSGTGFIGDDESHYTLLEMDDDAILTVKDETTVTHKAHYIPSLAKWIIADEDRFSLLELKK